MIIWRYEQATTLGDTFPAYGTPVEVYVPGRGYMQVVYQFGTPDQRAAVVHFASGRVIAYVLPHHYGASLQETARAAAAQRFANLPRKFARQEAQDQWVAAGFDRAVVINHAPEVLR
ncbi:hypothetical protein K0U83_23405 [bacterium]|nr:hypothetical protein [bacterium]